MNISKFLSVAALVLFVTLPAHAAKICLDPGHGGTDPGAIGCGLHEADIVLDTQLRLRDLLVSAGHDVIMTRDTDVFITLTGRTDYANSNGADRFVSIHANSADASSATGTETYCYTTSSSNSVDMRDRIQAEMILAWDLADRGGKTANFSVLRNSAMPATLSELGFVSNCSVDALLLADPDSRQQAAQAHLLAIQEHLGLEPGDLPGFIRGVVFADQGVGTADMSVLLPGALLEVLGQNEQTNASDPDAAWSFLLPAGSYTIHASLAGYQSAEKTCDPLVSSGTTWCSIGLFPDTGSQSDAGGQNHDATLNVDASRTDAATESTDAQAGQDSMTMSDASLIDDASEAVDVQNTILDAGSGTDTAQNDAAPCGCDCRADGSSNNSATAIILLLGLILLFARRLKIFGKITSLFIMLTLSQQALAQPSHKVQTRPQNVVTVPVSNLTSGEALLEILAIDPLETQAMTAPALSPDGQHILFAPRDLSALYLRSLDEDASQKQVILKRARAGLAPLWSANSQSFSLRSSHAPFSGQWLEQYNLQGLFVGPMTTANGVYAGQEHDRIFLLFNGKKQIIAKADDGDRFYAPMLSTDGKWLSYQGLIQGLFLYRIADGQKFFLGRGDHARFSEDGQYLLFERSRDDGEKLLSAKIMITDLRAAHLHSRQIKTPPGLAEYPSLSVQAERMAFVLDGQIVIAKIKMRAKE